jgi:adenosylcobinamide amidohydrolase
LSARAAPTDAPVVLEVDLEGGQAGAPALCWRFDPARRAISTAAVGGGLGLRHWVLNAQVPRDYARTDVDRHVKALARAAGCHGEGVGLLTAARVEDFTYAADDGVVAYATVGIESPTWAAAACDEAAPARVGTINIVVCVPTPLHDAAMVNAVATVTEAKVQALMDVGVPGTGTATDAVCVLTPGAAWGAASDAEPFAGPRSPVGAALARAVHQAVADGARGWLARRGRS